MNKDQAQRIIKNTFETKFNKVKFTKFIVELLNLKSSTVSDPDVAFNKYMVPNAYQPFINSFEKIADYKSGEHILDVLLIRLNKEASIERARTMQRNFIAWYLKGDCDGEMKDAALAAFVSPDEEDWRFSLIKMDYLLGEDKKGRVKISEEFTPAKRWSFLVGSNEKSHSAQSQLIGILTKDEINPTLTQLEEAFNVEKVTKEFFEKYRELFFWTKETLDEIIAKDSKIRFDFETKNINTIDFSKKLLGQIVFLYFLQKKGWFGVARDADWGTGPKNFLRELFEGKHGKYKYFFNDILEALFYDALRNDRSHNDDYYSNFNCKIPFLNGGLFDPINNYDWVHTDINLPNELFSNENKTKEGDNGTGILDIFDRYNFTVKEDEPLEKVVAVDPEMLGKVFENLLEVKDRKSKGTYYTPREIVHYMCQQSLINYLATELEEKVSQDDILKLIKYGEHFGENNIDWEDNLKDISESIIQNAESIDEKLEDIKVCDPAVGSGAFLVGMMAEIVRTRNVLSNYINDSNRTIYNFKRECIENSLYGVDIDPSAVEIAKLRLWLSLVVDEDDIKKVKPLPNLDYKIMQGNSLIEDFHGISLDIEKRKLKSQYELGSNVAEEEELLNNLYQNQSDYFNNILPLDKLKKKKEIEDSILKIFHYEIQKKNIFDHKLACELEEELLEIAKGKRQRNFFPWKLYFASVFLGKNGFDVVFSNPPYGANLTKKEKDLYKIIYSNVHVRTPDTFNYFISKGLTLAKPKGTLSYIVSNNLLFQNEYVKTRHVFCSQTKILKIINFGENIFKTAIVPSCVFIIQNINQNNYEFSYLDLRYNYKENKGLDNKEIFLKFKKDDLLKSPSLVFGIVPESINIIEKVREMSYTIDDIAEEVASGISTGGDKIFKITKKFAEINKFEEDILFPVLTGSEIDKYTINHANNFIIYSARSLKMTNYPNIFNYLSQFKDILSLRSETKEGLLPWWSLNRQRFKGLFLDNKIIMRQTSDAIRATLDIENYFVLDSILVFKISKQYDTDYRFLLSILNSKLTNFIYKNISQESGRLFAQVKPKNVRKLFIPRLILEDQLPFIKIVDEIQKIKKLNPKIDISESLFQIDKMIYDLYGLNKNEITVIENYLKIK